MQSKGKRNMPIFWRPQMSIGHDEIDADHRYLILLINTVELVLRFPENRPHIEMALEELRRYAAGHFEREERIQIAWGYIHLDQHKQEHRQLLRELDGLVERIRALLDDPAVGADGLRDQSQELINFLRHWLVDHVMKADMRLVPLFRKQKTI